MAPINWLRLLRTHMSRVITLTAWISTASPSLSSTAAAKLSKCHCLSYPEVPGPAAAPTTTGSIRSRRPTGPKPMPAWRFTASSPMAPAVRCRSPCPAGTTRAMWGRTRISITTRIGTHWSTPVTRRNPLSPPAAARDRWPLPPTCPSGCWTRCPPPIPPAPLPPPTPCPSIPTALTLPMRMCSATSIRKRFPPLPSRTSPSPCRRPPPPGGR